MTTTITARTAGSDDFATVTELCLVAFADEEVTAWVLPDPVARGEHIRHMFSESLEGAIEDGTVILGLAPDGAPVAASFWVERGVAPAPRQQVPPARVDHSPAGRMAAVESATAARRPHEAHLYLSSMATLPDHRGRGAGAVMLSAGLERARTLGLPVYLEASTADNRRLYERTGFRDLGTPIRLPGGGPTLQPMWLPAQGPAQ